MPEVTAQTSSVVSAPTPHTELAVETPEELASYQGVVEPEYFQLFIQRYNEAQRLAGEILDTASVRDVEDVEGYLLLLRQTIDLVETSPFKTANPREKRSADHLEEDVAFVVLKSFIRGKLTASNDLQPSEWTLVNEALGPMKSNTTDILGPNKEYKKLRVEAQKRCVEEINEASGSSDRAVRLQEIIEDVLRDILHVHEQMRKTKYEEMRLRILPPATHANDVYSNVIVKISNLLFLDEEVPGVLGINRVWKKSEKAQPSFDPGDDPTLAMASLELGGKVPEEPKFEVITSTAGPDEGLNEEVDEERKAA